MRIFQLFTSEEVCGLRQMVAGADFVDGRASAHGYAASLKSNRQISANHPVMKDVLAELNNKLASHTDIAHYAYPARVVGVRINSYGEGDAYGWHVDNANMDGFRTDLSFTVFLNNRDEYEGGELELNHGTHMTQAKGEAGQVVIYPTGVPHQVRRVVSGQRMAIVGWIRSHIKQQEHRDLLFNMAVEIAKPRGSGVSDPSLEPLRFCYQGLVRAFTD